MKPFQKQHTLSLLGEYEESSSPVDRMVNRYFRAHRALGSKDRRIIGDLVFDLVRWKGWIDHHCTRPSWEKRLEFWLASPKKDGDCPPHVRASLPESLWDILVSHYGPAQAMELALVANTRAPLAVRANRLVTTREELIEKLKGRFEVSAASHARDGVIIQGRPQLLCTPEYRAGLFEMQDEGSQQIASLVNAEPGEWVLDYCAGGGGKSLALAAMMENRGQLFLHDIRKKALLQAKQRLRRAGVQNGQISLPPKGRCHRVFVDAPCSGSGTWRRNVDMKWRLSVADIERYCQLQRDIVREALDYVRDGGELIYATCSLFPEENEKQRDHFVVRYGLKVVREFCSLPKEGEMDGFYGVALTV